MRIQTTFVPCLIFAALISTADAATNSIRVSGRELVLPSETPVLIDGIPGQLSELVGKPGGMQLQWQASALRGAPALVFSYNIIGPVTKIAPLEVLGQAITITGDTVLEGFTTPGELVVGAPMVLAGLVDANGSLYSTLAVRRGAQGNKYLLTGYVQELAPARVRVGQQWLSSTGVVFNDCATPLPVIGDYLEVRADSIANFQTGDTIDMVTSARCATPVAVGTPGAIGVLEGLVQTPSAQSFLLGPVQVRHDANTVFQYGDVDDLDAGVDVIVEGSFLSAASFDADLIEFVRPAVRFEVPMLPSEITPGLVIRPFGVLVHNNAQVRDDENILSAGLSQARQVQVRGWLDRNGTAHALRVRTRGNPDASDVSLRAPISAFTPPIVTAQGLSVDTTGASFFDADNNPINAAQFFAALRINHVIDVSQASWLAASRTLRGGSIVLLGFEHTQPLPPAAGAILTGTVNSFGSDVLYRNGFE